MLILSLPQRVNDSDSQQSQQAVCSLAPGEGTGYRREIAGSDPWQGWQGTCVKSGHWRLRWPWASLEAVVPISKSACNLLKRSGLRQLETWALALTHFFTEESAA